jgi:methylated-DNA-protein-cysteine methyltransferase-like protein
MADTSNFKKIWRTVKKIPKGCVSTYGEVARMSDLPRRARLVGTALRAAPADSNVPWHRVVNAKGQISFPLGSDKHNQQKAKLQEEGIVLLSGSINLEKYAWQESCDEALWRF